MPSSKDQLQISLQDTLTSPVVSNRWKLVKEKVKELKNSCLKLDYSKLGMEVNSLITDYNVSLPKEIDLESFDKIFSNIDAVVSRLLEIYSQVNYNYIVLRACYETLEEFLAGFSYRSSESMKRAEAKEIILNDYIVFEKVEAFMKMLDNLITMFTGKAERLSRRVTIVDLMTRTALEGKLDSMKGRFFDKSKELKQELANEGFEL